MVALPKVTQATRYDAVPNELKNLKQWARYTKTRVGTPKERDKAPAHLNGRVMSWSNQDNWLTFEQVEPFDKIGSFTILENGIVKVDYDGCIDENGVIHPLVLSWIKNTYAEISPSKKGVKAYFRGTIPDGKTIIYNQDSKHFTVDVPWANPNDPHTGIEIYAQKRFFTVTGNIVPGCPSEINEANEALNDMLIRFAPAPKAKKKPPPEIKIKRDATPFDAIATNWNFDNWVHQHLDVREQMADGYIIACPWAHLHTTPGDVARIWEGPPHTFNCFHAHCNGREWPDVRLLFEPDAYEWKKSRSIEQSIIRLPSYPQITIEEQMEQIAQAGRDIKQSILDHYEAKDGTALCVSYPQGTGKSYVSAEFVVENKENIITAWMSPTKEVAHAVKPLREIYHIQPVNQYNCPTSNLSHKTSEKGYNATRSIHKYHQCEWLDQPFEGETVVFMQQYYNSSYPGSHDLVINDEANLPDWLPERKITISQLQKMKYYKETDSEDYQFIQAVEDCIHKNKNTPNHGKSIFDRANKDEQLTDWLGVLIPKYADTRPKTEINLDNDEFDELDHLHRKPDVILPHLVKAFASELAKWQTGKEWNSRIRIGRDWETGEAALFITEPRELIVAKGHDKFPPFVHLDGCIDEEIHSLMFGMPLKIVRASINPAPYTLHFGVRTGCFFGKTANTAEHKDGTPNETLIRTIKICRYMLNKLDPEGHAIHNRTVALISFMDCVDEIADALGIPEDKTGYYWNVRGSNSLEKCEILLLVGTPILPPQKVATMARSLYFDDPEPIVEDWTRENGYVDARLQHLAQFITNSELTQAAHRIRPIRHANKTIISLCTGEIDYLPIIEEFTSLPNMTEEGENMHTVKKDACFEKLRIAYEELSKNGERVKLVDLASKSGVRKQTASKWLKDNAIAHAQEQSNVQNGGSRGSIESSIIEPRELFSISPEKETNLMFDPTDLQQYRGIEKGARVTTPIGQGEVCRIGIRDALGIRVAVYVDGCTTGLQSFAWNEVHPIVEPVKTSERFNASLDELFAGII